MVQVDENRNIYEQLKAIAEFRNQPTRIMVFIAPIDGVRFANAYESALMHPETNARFLVTPPDGRTFRDSTQILLAAFSLQAETDKSIFAIGTSLSDFDAAVANLRNMLKQGWIRFISAPIDMYEKLKAAMNKNRAVLTAA